MIECLLLLPLRGLFFGLTIDPNWSRLLSVVELQKSRYA